MAQCYDPPSCARTLESGRKHESPGFHEIPQEVWAHLDHAMQVIDPADLVVLNMYYNFLLARQDQLVPVVVCDDGFRKPTKSHPVLDKMEEGVRNLPPDDVLLHNQEDGGDSEGLYCGEFIDQEEPSLLETSEGGDSGDHLYIAQGIEFRGPKPPPPTGRDSQGHVGTRPYWGDEWEEPDSDAETECPSEEEEECPDSDDETYGDYCEMNWKEWLQAARDFEEEYIYCNYEYSWDD